MGPSCWLPSREVPATLRTPRDIAAWELTAAGMTCEITVEVSLGESYCLDKTSRTMCLTGGETGVLYGAYALLRGALLGEDCPDGLQRPVHTLRMLNHWDRLDGSVERGYAGPSLFFRDNEVSFDPKRIRDYARLLASVGINTLCLNNVNVTAPAQELLTTRYLPRVAELADLFRPFGIRLLLAVDYAMPLSKGIATADPLDGEVIRWWRECAATVYRFVPDLRGFLVKADSEHRPGPFTYGRDHAQGANLLARALQPFGGVLIWRCFVYNCGQDWRDASTDRAKAAYEHYAYLDGQCDPNVILQIKHGPFDFQVREPISPLLLDMPHTAKALELQLTQEYTGQQVDLYAMQGMWNELFADIPQGSLSGVAAVANVGDSPFWTGHPFAQFNLFAYGLTAWRPMRDFTGTAREWARLTYGLEGEALKTLCALLLTSRDAYEKYTATLGLGWMVNPGHHYGPSPMGYEYSPWGTYHRADHLAVGVDRTAAGTGFLLQYPEALRARYQEPTDCPENLLLFFHRLPYAWRMRDGRTLLQRIFDDYREGVARVASLSGALATLEGALPDEVYREAADRMRRQLDNAREWRDVVCDFFTRLSGMAHENGEQ